MSDARTYLAHNDLRLSESDGLSPLEVAGSAAAKLKAVDTGAEYHAVSPSGTHVSIPKELFIALSDFIKTRKCPGSISIQFRAGEITCVEAIAKKTYRSNP